MPGWLRLAPGLTIALLIVPVAAGRDRGAVAGASAIFRRWAAWHFRLIR
jgi:hypothetical protein